MNEAEFFEKDFGSWKWKEVEHEMGSDESGKITWDQDELMYVRVQSKQETGGLEIAAVILYSWNGIRLSKSYG